MNIVFMQNKHPTIMIWNSMKTKILTLSMERLILHSDHQHPIQELSKFKIYSWTSQFNSNIKWYFIPIIVLFQTDLFMHLLQTWSFSGFNEFSLDETMVKAVYKASTLFANKAHFPFRKSCRNLVLIGDITENSQDENVCMHIHMTWF